MEVKKSLSRLTTIRLLNIRTVARISWVPCMSWARPCHQMTHFISLKPKMYSLAKREDCQTPTAEIHPVLRPEILKPDLRRCSQRRRHAAQWLLAYRTRFNSAKSTRFKLFRKVPNGCEMDIGYHLTDPSRVTSLHCTLQVLTGAGTKFCFTFVQEESSDWTSMWQMVPNRTSDHLSQPIPRIAEASNPCAANILTPPNNKYFFIHPHTSFCL